MVREIIQIGDKRLLEASEVVPVKEIASADMEQLYTDLLETAKQTELNSVGLSAVQIGVMKRVFVFKRINRSEGNQTWEIVINPEIELLGKAESMMWEGCLSVGKGDNQLFAPVNRTKRVRVKYLDREGKPQQIEASGYLAHVLQHEYDHLEGKLFLNYVSNPENIWKSSELDVYLDQYGSYPRVV